MTRFILLNAADVHQAGDEIFNLVDGTWEPIDPMFYGDPVGESNPCRRALNYTVILRDDRTGHTTEIR